MANVVMFRRFIQLLRQRPIVTTVVYCIPGIEGFDLQKKKKKITIKISFLLLLGGKKEEGYVIDISARRPPVWL